MTDPEGIKTWVYSYLQSTKRIAPEYTFIQKPAGRGQLRFICELRAQSFDYVGIGNSKSKKDAQTNAARDFANYLIREGHVPASAVPLKKSGETGTGEATFSTPTCSGNSWNTSEVRPTAPARDRVNANNNDNSNYINRIYDQKKLEEAEEVDLTADIHGGWSMENAKSRLNEYLQATKQEMGKEEYTALGPDHNSARRVRHITGSGT